MVFNKCECYNCGCSIDEGEERYIVGEAYCDDCVVYSSWSNDYILAEDARWVRSVGTYLHCDDCVEINGGYYRTEDTFYCECCNCDCLLEGGTYVEITDETVCNDCLDQYLEDNNLEMVNGEIVKLETA